MNVSKYFQLERYRYSYILLRQLVITDFKLRYQGSVLGYMWSLLKPLGLFGILYVVFSIFLRVGEGVDNFPVYLLLGIVIWNYFAEVTNNSVESIVQRGDLIRKINFPKYVIVLAGSFSAFINLIINLVVVYSFMAFNSIELRAESAYFIFSIAQLFVFALALSFMLSALYVRFRDINYIWEILMQGAFYATPILYPIALVPELAAKIIILNPVAQLIQDARYFLLSEDVDRISDIYGTNLIYLAPLGFTVLTIAIASSYFKKRSPYFAEEL